MGMCEYVPKEIVYLLYMAFTRFHDDPCRIMKQLQQSTSQGLYYLNTPGMGLYPTYIQDAHIIPQKWGGNYRTNGIAIESSLRGLETTLSHDCNESKLPSSESISYPINTKEITTESRVIAPVWTLRNQETSHWDIPLFDPQENITIPFHSYQDTRILEKDQFNPMKFLQR